MATVNNIWGMHLIFDVASHLNLIQIGKNSILEFYLIRFEVEYIYIYICTAQHSSHFTKNSRHLFNMC